MENDHLNETRLLTPTVWKNSLFSFFKILLMILLAFMFFLSAMFFVCPRINVSIFGALKMDKAQEASLVQTYEKSGKSVDLYNLIVFEQSKNEYYKELYYINELQSREDFSAFCEKLDDSSLGEIGSQKGLIPVLCNTRSYLNNQKIKCLWNLEIEAKTFVFNTLCGDYEYEYSFSTYVYNLSEKYNAEGTKEELKSKYQELLDTTGLNDGESSTIEQLLNQRIEGLKVSAVYESEENKIKRLYTLSNLASAKNEIYEKLYGKDDSRTVEAKQVLKDSSSALVDALK